jgi:hypothetical protein
MHYDNNDNDEVERNQSAMKSNDVATQVTTQPTNQPSQTERAKAKERRGYREREREKRTVSQESVCVITYNDWQGRTLQAPHYNYYYDDYNQPTNQHT